MKENDELINGNRESGIDLYPREDESVERYCNRGKGRRIGNLET